jgi:hypothetical protein
MINVGDIVANYMAVWNETIPWSAGVGFVRSGRRMERPATG